MRTTFLEELAAGRASPQDIDEWIERWHQADAPEDLGELHEYLGLTWPEYAEWITHDVLPDLETRLQPYQYVRLQGGAQMLAHGPILCAQPCPIHWPSQHHMRGWRQHWRSDRGIMERTCPCGVGHPDPDDRRVLTGEDSGNHGCCGCCRDREPVDA